MMSSPEECLLGTIIDRFCLNKPDSSRQTWHIVIDLSGVRLPFRPGDSIGIWPQNPKKKVQELLRYFQLDPSTSTVDPTTKKLIAVDEFLLRVVDLSRVTSTLINILVHTAWSHEDRARLVEAQSRGGVFDEYDVVEFLQIFVPHKVSFIEILPGLVRIRPRLYSISSGPSISTQRIELTVAKVQHEYNGRWRPGLCSHYLIHDAPLHVSSVRLFHQPSKHFFFPTDQPIPLVMIGSGTGIAPFRAFMQEVELGVIRPAACWLFFGERQRKSDFFYEDFWTAQVHAGLLRLDLAFSRDQQHKVYVQDLLWDKRAEVWRWMEEGAAILVCGNAKTMAKDVDTCLHAIVTSQANLTSEDGFQFLRALHRQKRYLRDLYTF